MRGSKLKKNYKVTRQIQEVETLVTTTLKVSQFYIRHSTYIRSLFSKSNDVLVR
jgi:hypothetical protein